MSPQPEIAVWVTDGAYIPIAKMHSQLGIIMLRSTCNYQSHYNTITHPYAEIEIEVHPSDLFKQFKSAGMIQNSYSVGLEIKT